MSRMPDAVLRRLATGEEKMVLLGYGLRQPRQGPQAQITQTAKQCRRSRVTEKRALFDFEVDFSNGGGIQGQAFRLDIDGDDILDEALAAHVIQDLRLLMVSEVRFLNKCIIEEP